MRTELGIAYNDPNSHFSIHTKENVPSKDGYFGVAPDDGGRIVPWKDTVDYIETEAGVMWKKLV